MTDGKKIELYIKKELGGIIEFSKVIGRDKSYLYNNLRKDPLRQETIDLLIDHGIPVSEITNAQVPVFRKGLTEIEIFLDPKRKAYIQLPIKHSDADLEKIARVVRAYKS